MHLFRDCLIPEVRLPMNAKRCLYLSCLTLLFSFVPAGAQTGFSQNNPNAAAKNYYSFSGDAEKLARVTKPAIYDADSDKAKSAPAGSNPSTAKSAAAAKAEIEHRVFDLVNERRAEAGLQPLTWNENVAGVARVHSANMANYKFFSHTGVDGKRVDTRADSLGVKKWHALGENIAYNRGFKSPLESAVQSWMNSPGHRENILKSDWQESGIGVVVSENGAYYFTQVFLKK